MRGFAAGFVAIVTVVAACGGGDEDLCARGFDAPAMLVNGSASVGFGGDAYTIVYPGRQLGQLVWKRVDYAGAELLREEELTPGGGDPSWVHFSDSGDFVSWLEDDEMPVRLVVARITPEGTLADRVVVADTTGTARFLSSFALADDGAGHVAALWGDGADLFLSPITAGAAAAPVRVNTHYLATMIATPTELAIGFADDRGAVLDRRHFDGTPVAPQLVVVPGAPGVNAMCWDGDAYQVAVDSFSVSVVRTDGTTVSAPRTVTDDQAGLPAILCAPGKHASVLAWTTPLSRGPSGNIETSRLLYRHLDRDGATLDDPLPMITRIDALNVTVRLHAATDGSVVAAWDEYSDDAPPGVRLVAARCR